MISAADRNEFLVRRNYLLEILLCWPDWRDVILTAPNEEYGYGELEAQRSQVALKHRTLDSAQILCGERHPPVPVIQIKQGEIGHEEGQDGADQVEAIVGREPQRLAQSFRDE